MLTREGEAHLTVQHHREGVGASGGAPTPDRATEFEDFYLRNTVRLTAFLLRLGASSDLAADLAQETMIAVYERWDQIEQPEPYMFLVARRMYWRLAERERRQTPTSDIVALADAVSGNQIPSAEASVMSRVGYSDIAEALAMLPERQRTVLTMRLNGATMEEIAQRINSSTATVSTHLHRARRTLRDFWLRRERPAPLTLRIPLQRTDADERARASSQTVAAPRPQEDLPTVQTVDSGPKSAQEQFATQLKQLRREVGNPSFQELASRVDDGPSKSSMYRVMSGRHIPQWVTVHSYLVACGVDPHEINTMWRQRWADAVGPLGTDAG